MKFEVNFSKEMQIQYYIFSIERVLANFYGDARHIVLPYKTKDYWYIPDYDLMSDPKFVTELQKYHEQEFFVFENEYLKNIVTQVFDEYVSEEEIKEDKPKIIKIEKEIMRFVNNIFEDISFVSKIIIIPSKIGTVGTFSYSLDENRKIILYCTYRIGDIEHLPITIFAGFIQQTAKFASGNFKQFLDRQVIMSFFQNFTKLGKILDKPSTRETLVIMSDDKAHYIEDSAKYLAKMGFPVKACFSYDKGNIYFNSKALLSMQPKEIEVLKLLIDKKSSVVSFDEIAKAYWKNDWIEKFSLTAIAKIIEKIRKSLLKNGIKFEVIGTVRKRGYILYD